MLSLWRLIYLIYAFFRIVELMIVTVLNICGFYLLGFIFNEIDFVK